MKNQDIIESEVLELRARLSSALELARERVNEYESWPYWTKAWRAIVDKLEGR